MSDQLLPFICGIAVAFAAQRIGDIWGAWK
jgi:hypothetical protein